LAGFVLHFFFIIAISSRELLWILPRTPTILPAALNIRWQQAEKVVAAPLGQGLASSNPLRQELTTYFHLAGIEAGYGFFAPNISGSCKLVFELHYPDGRVEYQVPSVSSHASGLRVATLLDQIGRPQNEPLREVMLKMLASSIWQEHPDVKMIRAIFGSVILPSVSEFEGGMPASSEFLFAYDFTFRDQKAQPNP
jgi:hypothetical protein